MGDFFAQNDTTSDLVNLAFGVTDIAMQSAHKCPENAVYRAQQDPGGVGTLQDVFCLIKIDLMGLLDRVFLFFAFLLILGGGVFQFLNSAVLFFELPDVVFALPPESESTLLTQIRALFNGFTDGIIEQADIAEFVGKWTLVSTTKESQRPLISSGASSFFLTSGVPPAQLPD